MITISDVAREAGVSQSTVSRALNNSPRVSMEKKVRIQEAVERLGYVPIRTSAARQAQQNKVIVIVSSSVEFYPALFESVSRSAANMGCQTVIAYTGDTSTDEGYRSALEFIRMLPEHMVFGLIVVHNTCSDEKLWREFCEWPLVQIGEARPASPMLHINLDDFDSTYQMTSHLISRGYRRIAYVNRAEFNKAYSYVRPRYNGFLAAMESHHLEVDSDLIFDADTTPDAGVELARKLLALDSLPDAVFCAYDLIAVSCISELRRSGVSIPGDIAVCGFDNEIFSEISDPALTTIAQSLDEMGAESVRLLELLVGHPEMSSRTVLIPPTLVIREST